jgi:MerR family Zn(II)-responsive transcriptional regulator of zntA
MIVSELALQAGISTHAVRYYARIGLLKPHHHPENRYKLFKHDDIHRIHFIKQAKMLGFKLKDIETLLDQAYQGKSVCPDVRNILRLRIEQNKKEINQLQSKLKHMEGALQRWEHVSDRAPNKKVLCPLIESEYH